MLFRLVARLLSLSAVLTPAFSSAQVRVLAPGEPANQAPVPSAKFGYCPDSIERETAELLKDRATLKDHIITVENRDFSLRCPGLSRFDLSEQEKGYAETTIYPTIIEHTVRSIADILQSDSVAKTALYSVDELSFENVFEDENEPTWDFDPANHRLSRRISFFYTESNDYETYVIGIPEVAFDMEQTDDKALQEAKSQLWNCLRRFSAPKKAASGLPVLPKYPPYIEKNLSRR